MLFELGLLAFVVAINLVLGVAVYRRNPTSVTNQLFGTLSFVIAGWSIANYFSTHSFTEEQTLFWIRIVMSFATANSVLFFLLMHTFPRATFSLTRKTLLTVALLTGLTMATAISPFLFVEIEGSGINAVPQPGFGMVLFIPVAILTIPLGLLFLVRNNLRSHGIERTQLRYLLLGVSLMFALIITLIFGNVVIFGNASFVSYSGVFTLPFVGLTAYAIIRHRLLDIRAAIFRTLSLSILVGAVLLIYGLLLVTAVPIITDLTGLRGEIIAAIAALISIPLARYVQQFLTKITDRFLFQKRADYKQALVQVGESLSGTIKINDVTDTVIKTMREIVRSKKTIIFLKEPTSQELIPRASDGVKNFHVTIPHDHVLLQHLSHTTGPLVKDELARRKEQERSPQRIEELEEVTNALIWLDASAVLPLVVNKELTGIIVLGNKLSGEPYLQDDTNFLAALAPQAATALENARLYQESLEFGEKLKLEVARATHELATANEQLRDLDKAKSEFLSIASHQLYTPLTALRGYLSMLQEGDYGKVAPKQRPVIDILEQSAKRLIDLIKNLLDISRIESGRLELDLGSINLVAMTRGLVQDLMPNAMNKNLDLQFKEPEQPLPHVVADRQRLRQVMLNFIDNAIKYTTQGSIDVTIHQQGDQLIFAVTDTGKGITQQEITKLFTKFTRVGGADRFHTTGTGLGLYVARQIVQEHNGRVDVVSPGTGQGSTFSMHLPTEGSPRSLKIGEQATVVIKAAEAHHKPQPEKVG